MTKAIIFLILYLSIPPMILGLGKFMKDQLKYSLYGRKRSRTAINQQEQKDGLNARIKKRLNFTLRDPRNKPLPFRLIFLGIYLLGAIISVISAFKGGFKLFMISLLVAYVAIIFSYVTADKIVKARDAVLKRMLDLKGSKMRLATKGKNTPVNINNEIRVLEWGEDLVSPISLHLYMPPDFDTLEVGGFLESFNLIFSSNGQWIANDKDKEHPGFDFNAGVASIRVSPKLPNRADWHERYLKSPEIHWSYFPLAIGSENGVPVYNEELDIHEPVLGFAVNSGQEKLSKKRGTLIGGEITAAPQILIAGGTGGGKSLSVDTLVATVTDD